MQINWNAVHYLAAVEAGYVVRIEKKGYDPGEFYRGRNGELRARCAITGDYEREDLTLNDLYYHFCNMQEQNFNLTISDRHLI